MAFHPGIISPLNDIVGQLRALVPPHPAGAINRAPTDLTSLRSSFVGNSPTISSGSLASMRSGAPAAHHGPEAFKQFLVSVHAGLSDLEIFNEDEIAEGDQVVVRWKMQGTHIGELSGIPPTGKHVKWTGITIYRIINGKVVEEKGEEDALGVLQQLGVVPSMS